MPAPIISWYNADNTLQETSWDIGIVDAGFMSPEKTFLIWNNRGGATDVSDAINCTITVKDSTGNNTGEFIDNLWIQVRVDSLSETEFTPIGGTTVKAIGAGGGAPTYTIQGLANNGTLGDTTADKCYARVTLRACPPETATSGNYNFILRVSYQYV